MALSGRAFVVTGRASGIGRATVEKLLQLSATVHVVDKAPSIPIQTAGRGKLVPYTSVDVSCRRDMARAFDDISHHKDALRGLANCAGTSNRTPVTASAEADAAIERLWKINMLGSWIAATEFHRCLDKAPGGDSRAAAVSVVNIASMAALTAFPGFSGYVISKNGVIGLTRSLAQEWGREGIRVNCVAPGFVDTPLLRRLMDDTGLEVEIHGAVKDVAEPGEIADTVLYLLSEQSSNISGHVIQSNGGWA